ncbi:hypothetical protein BKA67DRAFT_538338 [Truncatella angustata]|uniref:Uncharacterized protein n=1 Tax=Truncatella angustata TaxID=152316 RepID=A0A9P8UE87_9PEZI|nr:uncharacterized protein BKA67DRAFT_538338 [Truncatella angustata]KAH6648288.1 hypothetical protein BKA67DRAFT_538338 [Truncatella angustata]KAH8196876.1 hypothetical protein TruAng_008958 [Truncatella angustata]
MPHPFDPQDIPIDEDSEVNPTKIFYLKGTIHFKNEAQVIDLTDKIKRPFDDFSQKWMREVGKALEEVKDDPPKYSLNSSGSMMRTIKSIVDQQGEKVCDLNMTFVSFDNSSVRFPPGSKHCRHEIELYPVGEGGTIKNGGKADRHECFIRHSVPYFWDLTGEQQGVLHKALNQKRVEVGMVAGYGWGKDAVLVFDDKEVDEVVAMATCIIMLNGKDAIDY